MNDEHYHYIPAEQHHHVPNRYPVRQPKCHFEVTISASRADEMGGLIANAATGIIEAIIAMGRK